MNIAITNYTKIEGTIKKSIIKSNISKNEVEILLLATKNIIESRRILSWS